MMENQRLESRAQAAAPRLPPPAVQGVPARPGTDAQPGGSYVATISSAISNQFAALANSGVNHTGSYHPTGPVYLTILPASTSAANSFVPCNVVKAVTPNLCQAAVQLAMGGKGNHMGLPTGGIGLPGGTHAGNVPVANSVVNGTGSYHPVGPVPRTILPASISAAGSIPIVTCNVVTAAARITSSQLSQAGVPVAVGGLESLTGRIGLPGRNTHSFVPASSSGRPAAAFGTGRSLPTLAPRAPSDRGRNGPTPKTSHEVKPSGGHYCSSTISVNHSIPGGGLTIPLQSQTRPLKTASTSTATSRKRPTSQASLKRKRSSSPEHVPTLNIAHFDSETISSEMMAILHSYEEGLKQESKQFPEPETPRELLIPPVGELRKEEKPMKPKPKGKMVRKRKAPPDGTPQVSGSEAGSQMTAGSSLGSVPAATAPSQSCYSEPSASMSSCLSHIYQLKDQQVLAGSPNSTFPLLDHTYSLCTIPEPRLPEQQPVQSVLATTTMDAEIDEILSKPMTPDEMTRVTEFARQLDSEVSASLSACSFDGETAEHTGLNSSSTTSQDSIFGALIAPAQDCSQPSLEVQMDFRPVSAPGKEQSFFPQLGEQGPVPRRRNTVSGDRPIQLPKRAWAEQAACGTPNFQAELPVGASIPSSGSASPLPVGPDREHLMTLQKPQARYEEPQQVSNRWRPVDAKSKKVDRGPFFSGAELPRESPPLRRETINKIPSYLVDSSMKPIVSDIPASMPRTGGISKWDLTATDIIPQDKEENVFSKLPEYHTDGSQSTKFDGMTYQDFERLNARARRDSSPKRPHSSRRASPDGSERSHRSDYSRSRCSLSSSSWRSHHRRTDEEREERHQIHIQPLPKHCRDHTLRHHFVKFGYIQNVKIIQPDREDKDPYAFVTYYSSESATKALEGGKTGDFANSTIGYGGRREFCETQYKDLDSKHAQTEDAGWNGPLHQEPLDYQELLKDHSRGQNLLRERDYDKSYKRK